MTETTATSPPDQDVHCPLCDYDLRGLTEARCPECGAPFDWDELRDPTRRKHPYLFEHHPNHNLWSFFRTLIGGLFPRRFWKTLSPVQPSWPRRLTVYWILCILLGSLAFIGEFSGNFYWIYGTLQGQRTGMQQYFLGPGIKSRGVIVRATPAQLANIIRQYGSVQNYIDQSVTKPFSWYAIKAALGFADVNSTPVRSTRPQDPIILVNLVDLAVMLAWPWFAMLVMLIFRASMRRSAVRSIHLLRVTLYCGDIVVWLGLAWLLVTAALFFQRMLSSGRTPTYVLMNWVEPLFAWIPLIALAALTYRLGCAMGRYLRFRHAMAMAISVQLIIWLSAMAFAAQFLN